LERFNTQAFEALMDTLSQAQPGCKPRVGRKRVLQDVPDFLFHRQAMPGSTQAQAGFEIVVKVSDGDAAHTDTSLIAMIAL